MAVVIKTSKNIAKNKKIEKINNTHFVFFTFFFSIAGILVFNYLSGHTKNYDPQKYESQLFTTFNMENQGSTFQKTSDVETNSIDFIKQEKVVIEEIKRCLENLFFQKVEIRESLPELQVNDESLWFKKDITVRGLDSVDNIDVIAQIKELLQREAPLLGIQIREQKSKDTIQFAIDYLDKNILMLTLEDFTKNQTVPLIYSSIQPMGSLFELADTNYFCKVLYAMEPAKDNTHEMERKSRRENISSLTIRGIDEKWEIEKPKIAIILDDGGYRNPSNEPALELPNKVNFSILPDTHYGQELAKKAKEKGFEIMIHMPMQTRQVASKGSFPCELLTTMNENEIKEKTKNAIDQFPDAKGVNNHTGGVFTLKEETLKYFMKTLKEQKLFFIDSVVVGGSKAYSIAIQEEVPSLQRDVFLDHEYSSQKIKESLESLKSIARRKGKAVGIGHFRDLTIQVLKEELPKLEQQGFNLVHVSELFE